MSSPTRIARTALVAALLALPVAVPAAHAGASDPTNPLAGQRLFVNCEDLASSGQAWNPWWRVHHAKGKTRSLLMRIARTPVVKSFAGTPPDKMGRRMERYMANVDHPMVGGSSCSDPQAYASSTWAGGPVSSAARDRYVGDYPVLAIRSLNYSMC